MALQKVMMDYGVVQLEDQTKLLILHDISTISYNDLQAQGLGYLDNKHGRGILCYSSIGISPSGLLLGLLYQHIWVGSLDQLGKSSKRKQLGFEVKESYHWYQGMTTVNACIAPQVHKIHIADREDGIYELFFHSYQHQTDLLIRARHNRKIAANTALWDWMEQQPQKAAVSLDIPDKAGKNKRRVKVSVRYDRVKVL